MEKKCGTIRKWIPEKGWGIINCYSDGGSLQKYFVHIKHFLPTSATAELGSRVLFIEGPSRSQKELPVALEVEIITEGVQS